MPTFKPAVPGQPLAIAASDWNAAMAAARRSPPPSPLNLRASLTPGTAVLVRNDTGGDLPAFVPVRLGATLTGLAATPDPLPYESRDRPLFAGEECDGSGVVAVLQEAVPEDAVGRAVVMGCTVARVAAGLAAGDAVEPPASGNVELVAGGSYGVLLSAVYGTGDRHALVLVGGGAGGGVVTVRADADNAGTAWTQGTVTGPGGGEVVDLQPRYGAGITAGSLTIDPHKLWTNLEYLCRDTGNRSPGTNRRRLYAWPIGLGACDSSVTPNKMRFV